MAFAERSGAVGPGGELLHPAAGPEAPLRALVGGFDPIPLAALGEAALLDRVDTKYVMDAGRVAPLLERLQGRYRVLEVGGSRVGDYRTRYFDTPGLAFYHAHHAGRLPRYKVRIRRYGGAGPAYLELKLKTNKARTHKTRVLLGAGEDTVERVRREALFHGTGPVPGMELVESLEAAFTRVTLVALEAPERVTVDLGLRFARGGRLHDFAPLAVVEIKQERHGHAFAQGQLRALGVREGALSKYCLGIASLESGARRNRFKPVLHALERTLRERPLPPMD